MLALAERPGSRRERAIALGALLGLVAGLALARDARPACHCPHRAAAAAATPAAMPAPTDDARAVEALYRAGRFDDAAEVAARAADPELRGRAELYARLGRAWAVGMDPDAPVTDAFYALRQAWKLDTVLGGAHAEALQRRLSELSLLAAPAFDRIGDRDAAELARSTSSILGPAVR
jgi:hypothetical protein